ncbi:MAG: M42 family metallopeptidase [Actinomycetota bacterium]
MNAELLRNLVSTPGISGREERIRDVVQKHMTDLVDDTKIDALGNLVGIKNGSGPRIMVCAHMDSIGFLVTHIDDDGFVRISPVGGFDPRTLVMQRVVVCGREADFVGLLAPATKPIHLLSGDDAKKPPKIEELFIDLMLPPDAVKAGVSVGDPVSLVREPLITDEAVSAPYLDDRLGVYAVLEALRRAGRNEAEIYAVVSVQEEVGVRGATTAAFEIEPAVGVAVDVTIAGDLPGADRGQQVCAIGKGVAIGLMDSGSISDPRLVRTFKGLAESRSITHQMEILPRGGTDAGGIQLTRAGVPVITISIPIRYVHTVNEMAYVSDIESAVDLLAAYLETAHEESLDWSAG